MNHLPETLVRTNIALHGRAGEEWLRDLPELVAMCEHRWGITTEPPFAGLSFNYAAPGVRADGTPVVLKICYPGKEVVTEIEALRVYAGQGAVRLIDADVEQGILLLQRAVSGDMLIDVESESEANAIAANVMQVLWKPVPASHPFPSVEDWGRGFVRLRNHYGGATGPFPPEITGKAERLFVQLCASSAEPVVLHGDLHHYNILRDGDQWLAIDPKGIVGEPAYEIGALMRNRLPDLADPVGTKRLLSQRITQIAEHLALDSERLRQWSFAQAVLSAWWHVEDGGEFGAGAQEMVALAELLDGISDGRPMARQATDGIRTAG